MHQTSSLTEMKQYLHAAAPSPVLSTCKYAIDKELFKSWKLLTSKLVLKYLPESVDTAQVNLNQTRKNARSTQTPVISTM